MEQKQNSCLGVAGMVIGIMSVLLSCIAVGGLTGIVGLVLSLIAMTRKGKKYGMAIAGIVLNVFAIAMFLVILFIAIGESDSNPTQVANPAPISKETASDDGIIDVNVGGCSLKYIRHEIKKDVAGADCIAVFYEFTNNSSETTSYAYTFADKAFQNGIELDTSIFLLDEIEDNSYKDIRPGVSVEVYSLFVPQDESVVELEVAEWISLSDKPLDTMMLSLQ